MAKRPRTAASDPWDDDRDMPPRKVPPGIHKSVYLEWRAAAAGRLRDVRDNLRLLAPPPAPALPASHEAGLRALGLLDFVRLRLDDVPPRRDLVAALVANYKQFYEWSYVRGAFVKVNLDAFAEALCLPLPAECPPDAAAAPPWLASAAEWFMEAYILKPLRARAAADKLPSHVNLALYRVKFGMVRRVDWSRLIWDLAEKEMVDLSKGKRPGWTCLHGAYLQRLIWVENPDLFQPALLGVGGDQILPSELESKMQEVEARSKLLDLRTEQLESKFKELEERTVASNNTVTELQSGMQLMELLHRNLLTEKKLMASELVGVQEELGEARTQLMQLDNSMKSMESLNKALCSRERKCNASLLETQWALVPEAIKSNGDLKSLRGKLAELQDGMQELESFNQVMCSRERESNGQLLDTRWALVTKEIKSNSDLKSLRGELAELQDGMLELESLYHVLVTKNGRDNDILQATRKKLIDGLTAATNGRASIGLKRMGELDPKAIENACRPRLSQKRTLILCSKWEAEIRNPGSFLRRR